MFNLSSLKAVFLGLSFKDLRTFTDGVDINVENMVMMDAVTDWAENYESEDNAVTPDFPAPEKEERPLGPPEPVKEVHLDIPPDSDFMILTAKVPVAMAEDFQQELPDWNQITYACEFMNQKEAMNDKEWALYGRRIWEAWFT